VSQAEEIATSWQVYRDLENRGDRAAMLGALETFVRRMEGAAIGVRETWVAAFLREKFDAKSDLTVRGPLFQRVLFPAVRLSLGAQHELRTGRAGKASPAQRRLG